MLGFVVLAVVTVTYSIDILPVIGPEVVKSIGTNAAVIDLGGTLLLAAAGGFVMLIGQAGDKFSHKPIFLYVGCGLTIIGGLLASFPPDGAVLILGRLLIGIGAVGMAVPCIAFLNLKFPVGDPARGLAFGLFASGFGLGFVIAPIIGGLLGDVENGWRIASLM
ncbi:MAG: MFS transporter, partial [Planctomycetaceae bacterium]|nr:MFS transporter [Planctomycetaceae bacterium]